MLSDEEIHVIAHEYVLKTYPKDCEILCRERHANPEGIYFVANRPGDLLSKYIGLGGFFVSRKSGEVWPIGSGDLVHDGLDYWLRFYDEGWGKGLYRLVIKEVKRPKRFAELLVKQRVSYVMLELEYNVVWQRVVEYTEGTVLRRIERLPCKFLVNPVVLRKIIPLLESEEVVNFEYSHIGNGPTYDWRPESYTKEQLGPQWE